MPISSSAASAEKKRAFRIQGKVGTVDHENPTRDKNFLTIGPALPAPENVKKLYKRSHSTLSSSSIKKSDDTPTSSDPVLLQSHSDGSVHISRSEKEKTKNPDRISLDRRGLTMLPVIEGEPRLRLLSLQHNLVNNLDGLKEQGFPFLVFLDIYDNQLEKICCLDTLENLRVLLMGKNRIKKIEGLDKLIRVEVLDLHGNQIQIVNGLSNLVDLKVLNLAGNQIKCIGPLDLQGLATLQELNLRRNRLKKLMGFGETPNLQKLFLSNNEVYSVEDMSSIAKASCLREISVDNNPVSLGGDCISFLVSYLPQLFNLNNMQVTEQVRKAAMAWRRNKETSNSAFMDLTSDVSQNNRREEVISNARTNWELLRSQTKCLATKATTSSGVASSSKNLKPDNDFILTSLAKPEIKNNPTKPKPRPLGSLSMKVPVLPDKKLNLARTSSQDTENSQNTSSSNTSSNEFFRLPPILVPIISRMESRVEAANRLEGGLRLSGSLSSIGPNVDSSVSSLPSSSRESSTSEAESSAEDDSDTEAEGLEGVKEVPVESTEVKVEAAAEPPAEKSDLESTPPEIKLETSSSTTTDTSSVISSTASLSSVTIPSPATGNELSNARQLKQRNVKSALNSRCVPAKIHSRAATAKPKKQGSPQCSSAGREREQGGDYLIEIAGRHLNIYGQGALRYIDKSWSMSKATDVNTVHFNYVNFNNITGVLNKLKLRFPNAESFVFKETNIQCFGQLNALAEVQGLVSLVIDKEGNPIFEKNWESYAVYRLSHWGLRSINGKDVTEEDMKAANEEYKSLSDLVLWSLPDVLLQPLLVRLRIDVNQNSSEENAKKWLLSADPALQSVVSKEALQWKKGTLPQEDIILRQKAKFHVGSMLDEMSNAINKLRLLDQEWPSVLLELVRNILLDYSQLDLYMKRKIQELK